MTVIFFFIMKYWKINGFLLNFNNDTSILHLAFKIKRTTPLQKLMDAYIEKMGFVC